MLPKCVLLAVTAGALVLAGCGSSKTVTQTVVSTSSVTPSASTTSTTSMPTTASPATSSTSATSQTTDSNCGSLFRGFVTHLTARGVGCDVATKVARGWLAQVQAGQNPAQVIRVQGDAPYACAGRFRGQLAAILCERNDDPADARVVFLAQP